MRNSMVMRKTTNYSEQNDSTEHYANYYRSDIFGNGIEDSGQQFTENRAAKKQYEACTYNDDHVIYSFSRTIKPLLETVNFKVT